MGLLHGLHGAVAVVLLCSLLFAEEAGVPMPAPGEVTLVAAGLLIAAGGLDPWVFVPAAVLAALAGAATGYGWSRLVGSRGLRLLAERFHQTERLARVTGRLREAGPREIAISRLIPGLRVYTTLVAGAAGVDRRRFFLGVAPVTAVWVAAFVALGALAGVPAEHFLTQVEQLIFQGGVLIAIGLAGYLIVGRVPDAGKEMLSRLPRVLRALLAAGVDMALLASVVAGVLAIARPLIGAYDTDGWVDILAVLVAIGAFAVIATRRPGRRTAGESLFETRYVSRERAREVRD